MFGIPQHNTLTNAPNNVVHGAWSLRGAGSLIAAPAPQIFSVPDEVYTIWVSMCAGGGGGAAGGVGGNTTFGNLLTATGGAADGGAAGSPNGQLGTVSAADASVGGSTPFGFGGFGAQNGRGWGSGGAGGAGVSAGSSGGWYLKHQIAVTPGMSILCTVGAGDDGAGSDGASGMILVEW